MIKEYCVTMITNVYQRNGDLWKSIKCKQGEVYFHIDVSELSIEEAIRTYIQNEIKNKTITIEVTKIKETVKTFQQKELFFGGEFE